MAAVQVFATYELLENILMHLPLRSLLLAQRVDISFRDLIWRSANINRALFFTPATSQSIDWYRPEDAQPGREVCYQGEWKSEADGKTVQPLLNPFLPVYNTSHEDAVQAWSCRGRIDPWISDDDTSRLFKEGEELAFSTLPRRFFCDYWTAECDNYKDKQSASFEDFLVERWDQLLDESEGSFKGMLVTHPPCRNIKMLKDARLREPSYDAENVELSEDDAGARFGPFIYAAALLSSLQNWFRKETHDFQDDKNTVEIVGGELWQLCPKSVDEITGWEMLGLMTEGS